jgi:hypothetical protein
MLHLRAGHPKSKFQPTEDVRLLDIVNHLGPMNWMEVAKYLPGRNARQRRERWTNYINPSLVKSEWTEADDKLIVETYEEVGPKWLMITGLLPGRARNDVKNRYFTLRRRALFESSVRSGTAAREQLTARVPASDDIKELPQDGSNPFTFCDEFALIDRDGLDWDPFGAFNTF